ncbi:MAG: TonB-dependent receptor [Gammaproteobacteria bacterium]
MERQGFVCALWATLAMFTAGVTAAAEGEAPTGALSEIVVTAQKREQSLQDVSLAVTAVDATQLSDNLVLSLEDIQFIAPSVSVGNSLGVAKVFIRGIGLDEQTTGIDPSVAVHVDGAVINQPIGHFTSIFDLQRVEILRGPQGTLYGRNATGGSINLITAKPTGTFQGYARASAGNYGLFVGESALSGPLTDHIKGRVAVRANIRGGYGKNEVTGTDVDDANTKAARAHLQFDFNDKLNFLLSGEWFHEGDHALGLKFKRATYEGYVTNARLAPLGLGGFPRKTRDFASEIDPTNDIETGSITGTLTWELSDAFTLVNLANYRDLSSTFIHDLDMSGVVNGPATTGQAPTIQTRFTSSHQTSDELQLHYSSKRLNGLVAAYYFKEGLNGDNRSGQTAGVRNEPIQRVVLFGVGEAQSWAAFTHLTYNITDEWAIKAGGRYTHEDRSIDNSGRITLLVNGMLGATIPQALPATVQKQRSFSEFTPLGGVEWRPREDLMLYYTYSEGFKSGVGLLGQFETGIAEPETIQNNELGFKSSWLQHRLTLNLSAFSYKLQNLQLGRTLPDPARGFVNRFENAAELEGKGVETELDWAVTENFRTSVAADYLDAEFTEFNTVNQFDPNLVLVPMGTFQPVSYAGNRPRNAPVFSYSVHGEYDVRLANQAKVSFGADVSHKGQQFFSEFNDGAESADAYTMLDARVTYRSADERWAASLWGKNLTDELVEAGAFVVSLSRTIGRTYLPPRTYGVTFDYTF